MFEQTSIDDSGLLKRPWAMTVSFAGQAAAVSAVALVSLVHTDSLPRAAYFTGVVAPPGPLPHDQSRPAGVTRSSKSPWRIFTAPVSIPKGISAAGPEAPLLLPDDGAIGAGVPGGID